MTNQAATAGIRHAGFIGMGLGAGLTIAFTLAADLVALALKSRGLGAALSVMAFFLAGFVTARIRPAAHPFEPAIGAGVTVLVFSVLQVTLMRTAQPALPALQVALSIALAVCLAFLAAWYGVRLSARFPRRRGTSPTMPR